MVAGKSPGYLAEVRDCGSGPVEANARLIAAAPDLLNAAIHALETLDSKHDFSSAKWRQMHYVVFYELFDAITRATGENNE